MKLIATRDFYNHPQKQGGYMIDLSRATGVPPGTHPKVVPAGAIFDIGTAPKLKDLSEEDGKLVYLLKHANVIGDATDAKLVKKVQAEVTERREHKARVAAEEKAEKDSKSRMYGRSDSEIATLVASAVAAALAQAGVVAPAPARR